MVSSLPMNISFGHYLFIDHNTNLDIQFNVIFLLLILFFYSLIFIFNFIMTPNSNARNVPEIFYYSEQF